MAILSLIIFGCCVVLFVWDRLPISVTALLGLITMILTGVVDFKSGFKNFGSSTVILICAMMVVGCATYSTGLAKIVGEKVIGLARGSERLIIIISTALAVLLSAFITNSAALTIVVTILIGVCAENRQVRFMNLVMPVAVGAVFGGALTLVGSTTQLTALGIYVEYFGSEHVFSFSTFVIPVGIICVLLVFYVGFVGYPLGKKIWGDRLEYNEVPSSTEETVSENIQEPNKRKMITMLIIFILTVLGFIFNDLICSFVPNLDIAIVGLISAVACVLTGCISHKEAIHSVNWTLAIWFCASLGIATGISESGGGELMARWFMGLFGTNVSAFELYVVLLILVVVLTQFLANSTVMAIVLPVAFSITEEMGFDSYSFAVGLTIAGAMAVATPLANNTIGMSMIGNYKFGDYFKYCGPITVVALLVLVVIVPVLYPLT